MNFIFKIIKKWPWKQLVLAAVIIFISLDGVQVAKTAIITMRKATSVCEQADIFKAEKRIPPPVKQTPAKFKGTKGNIEWTKCDSESCTPFKFRSGTGGEKKPSGNGGEKKPSGNGGEKKPSGNGAEKKHSAKKTERNNAPLKSNTHPPHPCERPCLAAAGSTRACHWNFTVENYWTMSLACKECPNVTEHCFSKSCIPINGVSKGVAVVNRQLPGPPIRACQGDTIVVNVKNKLENEGLSIHWHGITQVETPWMDGVAQITQCYIPSGTTFRYIFDVPRHGTYWWHAHAGPIRADGVFGALIVRPPAENDPYGPHGVEKLYNFDLPEHEIILADFTQIMTRDAVIRVHFGGKYIRPDFLLVNGRGLPPGYLSNYKLGDPFPKPDRSMVPLHELRITAGKSYRVRVINAGTLMCPVRVSIEEHKLHIISSDGRDIQNQTADSFAILAGERWDFVLDGNQPPGSYWMKFQGNKDCDERGNSVYQLAVLNYDTIPSGTYPDCLITKWKDAAPDPGLEINPLDTGTGIPGESMTIAELENRCDPYEEVSDAEFTETPDHQFILAFDVNHIREMEFPGGYVPAMHMVEGQILYLPQINGISNILPSSPPLTQQNTISKIHQCNAEHPPGGMDCATHHCACTHIIKAKLNSTIEFVIMGVNSINLTENHPVHFHGYALHVVGMGKFGDYIDAECFMEEDKAGNVKRKRELGILKDTFNLPYAGYIILRVHASNPGFWFIHCHLELHTMTGMSVILQVGEPHEMLCPADGFPVCGNFNTPLTTNNEEMFDIQEDLSFRPVDYNTI